MVLWEREGFLAGLGRLFAGARHGHGRVVLLAGEAGIGKTALAREFSASLTGPVRILWGSCDPVVPRRPFAPLVDIAPAAGGALTRALEGGDRDRVFDSFLQLLQRGGAPPTLVVVDDLHWADEATLDLIRVLGRRISGMSALMIGTYRDHEVDGDHPLRLALGDVPAGAVTEISVPPLSIDAVRALAADRDIDASALHAATAGNPFFVTEVLAAGGGSVPSTVRDAVLARVVHLPAASATVLRAAAVLGPRCERDVLLAVADAHPEALAPCFAHAILEHHGGDVTFRHELARRAVLDALRGEDRVALNGRALAVLERMGSNDPGRLARHAVEARDTGAVQRLAPPAGDRAAALGSHREAVGHYDAALRHAEGLSPAARADLLERAARERTLVDDVVGAVASQREALELWRAIGDRRHEGDAVTTLSTYLWLDGAGDDARRVAESALPILEAVAPDGRELARAYAVVAQRLMVSGQDDQRALDLARRALELAERLADEPVAVHAQTTMAVTSIYLGDEGGWERLEQTVERARAAGLAEDTTRALINLVEAALDLRRYDAADRYLGETELFMRDHDFDLYHHMLEARLAQLALERGRWDAAAEHARSLLERRSLANPIRIRALIVAGRLAARRGDASPWPVLDEAIATVGELEAQEIVPLHAARAEAAWLAGDLTTAGAEAAAGLEIARRTGPPWWWGDLALLASKAGAAGPGPHPTDAPNWLHVAGRHREAAEAWLALGAPYRAAVALADSDNELDLRHALEILHALRARPLAAQVTRRLVELGVPRVPRGPRARTSGNPGGLTPREVEVVALLGCGLRNREIAERLVLSPKTVDHHVSAVLRKLGVRDRLAAGLEAQRLGLKDGEYGAPNWGVADQEASVG